MCFLRLGLFGLRPLPLVGLLPPFIFVYKCILILHSRKKGTSASSRGANTWPGDRNGLWFGGPGDYSEDYVADM